MNRTEVPSYAVDIYVAGEIADARRICREQCMKVGLCVTVTEADFIYTGGAEKGVRVGLVNYPRFPKMRAEIWSQAIALAEALVVGLCQWSALVQATDVTAWLNRRPYEPRDEHACAPMPTASPGGAGHADA